MRLTEAKGRRVLSTSAADTVGRVDGFVVVPGPGRILALRLKKTPGEGSLLRWSALTAFGADAVTVPDADVIETGDSELRALADKHRDLLGTLVLDDRGAGYGSVRDADIDPADGSITTLITDGGELPGERMIGLGTYAVVVRAG